MRVQFVERESGPERLVCEAELLFDEEPLAGMKLVGFCLWRGADDELRVTLPSRAYGLGSERRYFDLLRSAESRSAETKRLKAWVLDEFRAGQSRG
jgi:hypothetical protein